MHVPPSNLRVTNSAENFSYQIVSANEVFLDLLPFEDVFPILSKKSRNLHIGNKIRLATLALIVISYNLVHVAHVRPTSFAHTFLLISSAEPV